MRYALIDVPEMPESGEAWEVSIARRRRILLALGLVRSVLRVKPLSGAGEYYRALFRALARSVIRGTPTDPGSFLKTEVWVRYQGLQYLLTSETVFGYYLHFFEPRTGRVLEGLKGDVCIDLGANTGQYAIPLSKNFRHVVAVEPNPLAVAILRRNLLQNGIGNVEVVQRAVRAEPGPVKLYRGAILSTWNVFRPQKDFIVADAISLDELLRPFEAVDLLKVDIEGAEVEVLSSATSLRKVKFINVGVPPKTVPVLQRMLTAQGFQMRRPPSLFGSFENCSFISSAA